MFELLFNSTSVEMPISFSELVQIDYIPKRVSSRCCLYVGSRLFGWGLVVMISVKLAKLMIRVGWGTGVNPSGLSAGSFTHSGQGSSLPFLSESRNLSTLTPCMPCRLFQFAGICSWSHA